MFHVSSSRQRRPSVPAIALCACLALAGSGFAQDPIALLKEANQTFRDAEKALFAGKPEDARAGLAKADALIGQILSVSPDHAQAKSLRNRVKQAENRLPKPGASATPDSESKPVTVTPPAPTTPAGAGIPSGAVTYLRQVDQRLDKATELIGEKGASYSLDYREQGAQTALQEARSALGVVESRHGAKMGMDHPELTARRERIAAVEKDIAAFSVRQANEATARTASADAANLASAPWIELLNPYVTPAHAPGHRPEKYLIPSATMEEAEMHKRIDIYAAASTDHQKYKASGLKNPTVELTGIDTALAESLSAFRDSMIEYGKHGLRAVADGIADARKSQEEQKAKRARGETVLPLQKDILPDLRGRLARMDVFLPPNSPDAAALRAEIEAIEKVDAEYRRQRIADTRMRPDAYTGADKTALVTLARQITEQSMPNAKALRVSIVWPEWKEESGYEYTDTTRTAIRHRVTRFVVVEVAAKGTAGTALHTLHIEKDRHADGSWSVPRGHVMHTDAMLDENVEK